MALLKWPKKPACKHMTGYWIDRDNGTFRCTDRCGYQFNIIDVKQDDARVLRPFRIERRAR